MAAQDVPSRVTDHFEIRPAAEQGPIIVCLDTRCGPSTAHNKTANAAFSSHRPVEAAIREWRHFAFLGIFGVAVVRPACRPPRWPDDHCFWGAYLLLLCMNDWQRLHAWTT